VSSEYSRAVVFLGQVNEAIAQVVMSLGDVVPIRSAYQQRVAGSINQYLYATGGRMTQYKNECKRAVLESFYTTFEIGLRDGSESEMLNQAQGDDLTWINTRVQQELGFYDGLFEQLRELKLQAKEDGISILAGVAEQKAAGYARTIDDIYSTGKVRGAGNTMLTFGGSDGVESCTTCQRLKGQKHRASWWKNHGLIIARGNRNYDCGCWQCEHLLFDSKGRVYTFRSE
jgi:hypothetical protein